MPARTDFPLRRGRDSRDNRIEAGHQGGDARLHRVGVLVFVHHDVAVAFAAVGKHFGSVSQGPLQFEQQIVIVEQGFFPLVGGIGPAHVFHGPGVGQKVRGLAAHDRFQGQFLVPAFAQQGVDGLVFGKTSVALARLELFPAMLQGGQDVVAVHDRDALAVAFGREQAQHGIGIGVEGAALHGGQIRVRSRFRAAFAHELAGAVQHLLGRFAGKRKEQDGGGRHPGFHQPGQTVDDGAGFAAARPGNDEQRAVQGGGGLKLGWVQVIAVIDHVLPVIERGTRAAGGAASRLGHAKKGGRAVAAA